ncbi:hypothetical protein TNCV_1450461 [Trichonephila clavipes]|nr:hypothetical protein TNCV_1450461 [Trichonephila clavipes]
MAQALLATEPWTCADVFNRPRLKEIAFVERIRNINFFVRLGKSTLRRLSKVESRCKAVIHYRERKLLSGIDVSEKAGKESKTANTGCPKTFRTSENIEKVSVALRKNRLQTLAESVGISSAACQCILTKDLNMPRMCQRIIPHMLNEGQSADQSEANPQVYVETPLHPEKLTVWCALWAGGIIGPYFFKNDEGHNVPVNGDGYRAMITNFFIPELNNHDVQELWFQQDGATCHTARATIDLLKDTFGDRLISRFGPVNWPPRSCDLTPLDYFLWGYVKSLVYADKPQTLDHLEDNIRRVIADIRPQMLEKVIENWTSRLDYIPVIRGSHMPEITFKM